MIQEAYVSFETAKLLKEKGFDEECFALYNPDGVLIQSGIRLNNIQVGRVKGSYSAPTQQMAMRWLREVHNIKVNVFYSNPNYAIEYFEQNTQTGVDESVFIGDGYDVYEQACEVAIKYCLENLI